MKLIIPIAGKGKRVRPHSFAKPKPFLRIAGKVVMDYLLEPFLPLQPEEIIIVHDRYTEESVTKLLPQMYPNLKFSFACQKDALGTGHAIYQAKEHVKEGDDIVIIYADMLLTKDMSCISSCTTDGIIFAQEVPDPQHYGVIHLEDGVFKEIVEKPANPQSNLANLGAFYLKDGFTFLNKYVKAVVDKGVNENGEIYLTDAFALMPQDGKKTTVEKVDRVLDTGTIKKLLNANAVLLNGEVVQGKNVQLHNTILGKNVSIGENTTLKNCTIENSIIGCNTLLEDLEIKDSIIGDNVILKKNAKTFNLGNDSVMQ